ncbi:MAG: MBL fold metallo-hydrolase [Rhodobacteraceae bacterium]|nr:MBL fold metallo-hydrolase [Paracoccaceae bacterium]
MNAEQKEPMTSACKARVASLNRAAMDMPLAWDDRNDFEDAWRGLVAEMPDLLITNEQGEALWDSRPHDAMLSRPRPDTVHPSLWRIAQLNNIRGLFHVAEGVWQVRGHSLANMTFVAGQEGWIVIDPATTVEIAAFGLQLVNEHLGARPVTGVVYSHTHSDHWGGVKGVEPVKNARIVAPRGFTEFVLTESIIASEGLVPRNRYMYGEGLKSGSCGHVDCGLGKATEGGTVSFLYPTDELGPDMEALTIDGVEMHFQHAPGEAPTGMHVWLPHAKVLFVADNCYASLHNIYTIRGSLSRDAQVWSRSVHQALEFDDVEVVIGGHHWPRWGGDAARKFLEQQSDALKYLHDQSVRLMRLGYTAEEVAHHVQLPAELDRLWHLRGYYGTVRQNARAIVQHYLGWYDGNPATLDPLPPREAARRMITYMGGVDAVIGRASEDLENGDERWVAQVMDLVLWADPDNEAARALAAKAHRRLGLTTENATWRNAYLSAASEFEGAPSSDPPPRRAADLFKEIPIESLLDFLAVRVDGPAASGLDITVKWQVTDRGKQIVTRLRNAVLRVACQEGADVTVTLEQANLVSLVMGEQGPDEARLDLSGDPRKFADFWSVIGGVTDNFSLVLRDRKAGEA